MSLVFGFMAILLSVLSLIWLIREKDAVHIAIMGLCVTLVAMVLNFAAWVVFGKNTLKDKNNYIYVSHSHFNSWSSISNVFQQLVNQLKPSSPLSPGVNQFQYYWSYSIIIGASFIYALALLISIANLLCIICIVDKNKRSNNQRYKNTTNTYSSFASRTPVLRQIVYSTKPSFRYPSIPMRNNKYRAKVLSQPTHLNSFLFKNQC